MRLCARVALPILAAVAGLAVLAPVPVRAQAGTLSGTVTDSATGQTLDGVTIRVAGTNLGAVTRDNGRYTILAIPPGTYTVTAQRIGYGAREVANVILRVDQTARLDFALTASQTLSSVRVEAAPPPLIDLRLVSSETSLTTDQILAFPAVSISEILTLSPGFSMIGQTASLRALAEERRGAPDQLTVRGGRGGATVQLVDGLPINNPVFGTAAFDVNPLALASLSFSPGYMEAQYGGGVSGVVNSAIREGTERLQGVLDFQTSSMAGLLGSGPDGVARTHLLRGLLTGPVGRTNGTVRFTLAGQMQTQKERVVQFPDSAPAGGGTGRNALPSYTGWHGFGGIDNDQVIGKASYTPLPSLRVTLTSIVQSRRVLSYDRRFLGTYRTVAAGRDTGQRVRADPYATLVQGSVRQNAHLLNARIEQRFDNAALSFAYGQIGGERETCNVFQGTCMTERFWRPALRVDGTFIPVVSPAVPYTGTGLDYGGEAYTSRFLRGDFVLQAADHHRLQAGIHTTTHDISLREVVALEGTLGAVPTATNLYRAQPTEFAAYVQDAIEYDFLSVSVGLRYDRGSAKGIGLANPLHASNGTTAAEVCEGTAPGINTTPFTFTTTHLLTGLIACRNSPLNANRKPVLLDSATRMAQADDFRASESHASWSPRLGVSFPLTDRSALFFNWGAYTKHPFYNDVYRNTGVGTVAGRGADADGLCDAEDVKPGTNECIPTLVFHPDLAEHVGNPNLSNERSTSFEIGYTSQIGPLHALGVTVYSVDQNGLASLKPSEQYEDVGTTYTDEPRMFYATIINGDLLTSRGISIVLRRRLARRWGYSVNYTWSRTTELGKPPELAAEFDSTDIVNEDQLREERVSSRNRAHAVNAAVFVDLGSDGPAVAGGRWLRNTRIAATYTWSSNSRNNPTPNQGSSGSGAPLPGGGLLENSPSNPVNLLVSRDFVAGNARYGVFLRASNLFNSQSCCAGLFTLEERRLVAAGLPIAGPEERMQVRRFSTGLSIAF